MAEPNRSPSPPRGAYLAWMFVCLAWGTTYLAIRIALDTIPPMLMGGVRWLVAGVMLAVAVAVRGQALPRPRHWGRLAVIGILMTGFGNGAVIWAEQTVPSGLAALLVASTPFWMVGLDRLGLGGAPVSVRKLTGLLVGFSGVVLLVWPELSQGLRSASFAGVMATQLGCLGWAAGSVYSRRLPVTGSVLGSSAMQMLFGGVALAAVGVGAGEWPALAFNATTLGALVYLIVVGSIAAYSAYGYALQHLPIATVSLYAFINPIIAVVLGTLVLAEPLSPRLFVAGALVLAGMLVVRRG